MALEPGACALWFATAGHSWLLFFCSVFLITTVLLLGVFEFVVGDREMIHHPGGIPCLALKSPMS